MGKVFKWSFIAFNILMLLWIVFGVASGGESVSEAQSEAEEAGAAAGTAIGVGLLVFLWVAGDVILGLFVLFTRPKSS